MATILGTKLFNGIAALEVDGDPAAGAGTTAPVGSFASANDGSGMYVKTGAADGDWAPLSVGAGETLAQTLVLGNTTGGSDLELSAGDTVVGEPGATAASAGSTLNLRGGAAGADAAGGAVDIRGAIGGSGAGGAGGNVIIIGGNATGGNASGGQVLVVAGNSDGTADGGVAQLRGGFGGVTNGDGGDAAVLGGPGSPGSIGAGGDATLGGGDGGLAGGDGGAAIVRGGAGAMGGAGGGILVVAGVPAGTGAGASIEVTASDAGGGGGFAGGSITLTPGSGDAPGVDGQVVLDGDARVTGNLLVEGSTTTFESETVKIADNHLYLNDGYATPSAQTGGLVVNYLPTVTADTVAAPGFAAGVPATSNPTVGTTGASTFTAGQFVQVSGAADEANDGLFEVLSHAANELTIRGVGTTGTVEDFTQNDFVTDATAQGTITVVNVSVIRTGSSGTWEAGSGFSTPLSFSDVVVAAAGSGTLTLQNAYEGGNSIVTDAGNGALDVSGTEAISLDAQAASNFTVDGANLTLSTTTGGDVNVTAADEVAISSSAVVNVFSGGVDVSATGGNVAVSASSLALVDGDGGVQVNSSGGAIQIGQDADTGAIDVGTGAAARMITIGNTTGATAVNVDAGTGDINLNADTVVTGKLTVTGMIDPPGLQMTESAANPGTVADGNGTLWLRDDTPNTLMYTDDEGTDFVVSGAFSGLASTLAVGNFTGGTSMVVSNGDAINGEAAAVGSNANGGTTQIRGGFGDGTGRGGALFLSGGFAGASGQGGPISIQGSDASDGTGGPVIIRPGNGGGAAGAAGFLTLIGGTSQGATQGGSASVNGGNNADSGDGGEAGLVAGGSGPNGGNGGLCTVGGGFVGNNTGNGGSVQILGAAGPAPMGSGNGGNVTVTAGAGGATSGDGGIVTLTGGSATSGAGGYILLAPGTGTTSPGTVGIGSIDDAVELYVGGTGGARIPIGTTAQRPTTPPAGTFRHNTTTGQFEGYDGTSWNPVGLMPPIVFRPQDNEPPSSGAASSSTINAHPVLTFTAGLDEDAVFAGFMPPTFKTGDVQVSLIWAITGSTAGSVTWEVFFERWELGATTLTTDDFGTGTSISTGVPSTLNELVLATVPAPDLDGLLPGEAFRLRVRRNGSTDSAPGFAALAKVVIEEV